MTKTDNKTSPFRSKRLWLILSLIVVILIILAVSGKSAPDKKQEKNKSLRPVSQGPLTIDVTESGTIKAREQIIIKSEVEGETTVLWVIPEATRVKKGDLLVELDATKLKDEKINQQIDVQNAESAFISAGENLAVAESQAQSDIAKAELDLKFAGIDLKKYIKGEYPNKIKELETTITLRDEEVQRSKQKFDGSTKLADGKYISSIELKTDELAYKKATLELDLAKNNLKLMEEYTHQRDLDQLESDVSQAKMALDRIKRKASANIVQANADLKAADLRFEREKTMLEKMETQITKATIYAPADGMVVYATSTRGSWRGNDEPLDEGSRIHEREELIHLPTANSVKAEVRVHEANMNKVKLGVPVEVEIEALPGKVFSGTVAKIAVMPDAQIMWMNPDLKVYNTEIYIDGDTKDLRTGMSCKARIIIDHYENATYIPIQAVVRIGQQPTVYVVENGQSIPKPVEIGLDNNRMIHIISGLKAGEIVDLTPPLHTSEVNESRRQPKKDNAKKTAPPAGQGKPTGQRPRGSQGAK